MENSDLENQRVVLDGQRGVPGAFVPEAYSLKPEKKSNECLECCGVCGLLLFTLAFIAGAVAYLVFGIIYLVQDYDVAHDCGGSSLWAYVLTAIILAWGRSGAKNVSTSDDDLGTALCTLVCLGFIEAGLAIWGGLELWDKSCDDLRDSNIWKFGLATFSLQSFCAFIFLVMMPLFLGCLVCKK